jgi:hypothetical protein
MPTIDWMIHGRCHKIRRMDLTLSPLPPMPAGRLPRTAIRARLREIAALRRSGQRTPRRAL